MNSGKKLGKNSAIMRKLLQLQKDAPPPPPPPPPPKPQPPPPPPPIQQPPPIEEQDLDNQFYDEECKQADKNIGSQQIGDGKFNKKVRRLNGVMERLSASVNELKQRYSEAEIEEIVMKKRNKRKEAQADAYTKSQREQKKQMMKKYAKLKQKQAKKQAQEQQNGRKSQQKEKAKKLEQVRKSLELARKQKEKEKQQQAKKNEKAQSSLQKYVKQKPLYERYEEKQEKRDNKEKQFQQAFLNKRSLKFKPIEQEELLNHFKLHSEKSKDTCQVKQQQKIEKQQEIMQQNLKLLDKIYRGKTYEMVQRELEERQKEKNRLKERRERIKKYEEYVRENFKPEDKDSDDENQQGELEEEQGEEEPDSMKYPIMRKVRKYKFLEGKSCGQIIENVKMPMSQKLQRRVGNGYLEHVLRLPKKRHSETNTLSDQTDLTSRSRSKIVEMPHLPRPKHFSVKVSDNPNRIQLNNMLIELKSKDKMVEFKRRYLAKMGNDREKYENIRNEINNNLIENIQRKLSMLTQL